MLVGALTATISTTPEEFAFSLAQPNSEKNVSVAAGCRRIFRAVELRNHSYGVPASKNATGFRSGWDVE